MFQFFVNLDAFFALQFDYFDIPLYFPAFVFALNLLQAGAHVLERPQRLAGCIGVLAAQGGLSGIEKALRTLAGIVGFGNLQYLRMRRRKLVR